MSRRMAISVHAAAVLLCLATIGCDLASGSCPDVVRASWGARASLARTNLSLPVGHVVIHHTYKPAACRDVSSCGDAMRRMQDMHQIGHGWSDIGYSFCVGGDGLVYEGRGWDIVGAHAPKYNFLSIGVCFIGDFTATTPSPAMLSAAKALIECGVARGSIIGTYTLIGHRQVRATECPGDALFAEIQTWPHWSALSDIQSRAAANATTPTPAGVVTDASTIDVVSNSQLRAGADATTSASVTTDASTNDDVSNTQPRAGADATTPTPAGVATDASTIDVVGPTEEATSEVPPNNTIDDVSNTQPRAGADATTPTPAGVATDASTIDVVGPTEEATSEVPPNNTIDDVTPSD